MYVAWIHYNGVGLTVNTGTVHTVCCAKPDYQVQKALAKTGLVSLPVEHSILVETRKPCYV